MRTLDDLRIKPNSLAPDGSPIFVPASNNPPLPGDFYPQEHEPQEHIAFGSRPEDWEGFEEDTEVPCGCG